ncbi:MAG TPA: recombinase family protein [Acetobacteraceae bacterium]|nr:recombinase family protein [Acetobacteraceae bacterium]
MASGKFISYLRVSTQEQGRSGLGLEAQRKAVADYLNGGRWQLKAEFVEVETGKRSDRPQLAAALAACRVHRATLVIAKLDRLSRNQAFLMSLRAAGVEFVCADMPQANRMTIGIMAAVAEGEAEMISARTRAALAAAKERGKALGGARIDKAGRGPGERGRAYTAAAAAARRAKADTRAAEPPASPAARGGGWSNVQVAALLRRLEARREHLVGGGQRRPDPGAGGGRPLPRDEA